MTTAAWLAEIASEEVYRDGAVELGTSAGGEQVRYYLHDGQRACHGLIVGGPGAGKTEAVRTVIHAVRHSCGEWSELVGENPVEDWAPGDHHVSDWPPAHPHRVMAQLEAIEQLLRARSTYPISGGARRPSPSTPGLLWIVEDLDRLHEHSLHAAGFFTRLEQVLRVGPRLGISVLATTNSLCAAAFNGSPRLYQLLARTNAVLLRLTHRLDTELVAQQALDTELDTALRGLPRGGGWAVVRHPDWAEAHTLRLRRVATRPDSPVGGV